ncbi:MAG: hypothetical protein IPM51_05350 [Sphingobacteriaceae bacterium]|nr:hypothetical protein [Sphingobacteriaceae bacterium]
MRRQVAIFCFIFFLGFISVFGQKYGNEWINYTQKYVKFPIHKEGIYRIDSTTLASKFDLNQIDPRNFQLFIGGEEKSLFIVGENDGKVNLNDYIEFYANAYDIRKVDSLVYFDATYVPSPYLPLYNDTIYAFLTLNTQLNNKRFVLETDTNSILYNNADYFFANRIYKSRTAYNGVYENTYWVTDPRYTHNEGYGQFFNKGNMVITNFSSLENYTLTPITASVFINYASGSIDYSVPNDHHIRTSYTDQFLNPVVLKDTVFKGTVAVRTTHTFNAQNLSSNSNFTLLSVNNPTIGSADNFTYLYYLQFVYPQNNTLNNISEFSSFIPNGAGSKIFYKFSALNFNGSDSASFYDITNNKKIRTVKVGNDIRVVIPNGIDMKKCYAATESNIIKINNLQFVNSTGYFTSYKNNAFNNPYVIIHHGFTKSSSQFYKSYRESQQGGAFQVINADISHLYEQFAYGNNKHPMAIRNLLRYLKDSLTVKPKYVLLLGKAIKNEDLVAGYQSQNLIPTMGVPSTDNMLSSMLSGSLSNSFAPDIPIGRVAALNDAEVVDYLTKVQQHESSPPADWKKRVLHFVGGNDEPLTNTLSQYMKNYGTTIVDTLFGGDTLTFRKNTTAPIQLNISDSIKNAISNGAALLNFFGHGSSDGFDQAIDDPNQYNNAGKYPFVIANSCYSGNIHIFGRRSVSEKFVFASQKGSIGFLATTSVGFVHSLNYYTTNFYRSLGVTSYNGGIGDIVKESAEQTALNPDPFTKYTALDMTLHGDPALKITNGTKPDYILTNNNVKFDLKTYTDSVGVIVNYKNLGKAIHDSVFVRIDRYYPNGDSLTVYKRKLGPFFKDSIKLYMLIDFSRGIGLNKFKVKIDDFNEIAETSEINNATIGTVDLFIPGGDILPVYPYQYAVVPKTNTITLKASTTDPFAPSAKYIFQLDTNDLFLNPIQSASITSKGGVLEWNVNLPFADSTVYFWRVSRDSTSPINSFIWKESSFQTINTKRGWAQAHFHQFKNDGFQFVKYKKQQRSFAFENSKNSISCRNGFYPYIAPTNISFFYNNIVMSNWGCSPNGWNIAIFDSISGEVKPVNANLVPGVEFGPYGTCHCQDNPLNYYSFGKMSYCGNSNWKQDLQNFLNSISPNDYVLAYTLGQLADSNAQISVYPNSLYDAFESIGAVTIRTTPDTVPYILFGKKGMLAGQGHEEKGLNKQSNIWLYDSIQTRWKNGYIASEIIGPSSKWNSLHWKVKSVDVGPGDQTILKVVGIKWNGTKDTLATFPIDSMDVIHLDAYADANLYPYLKLVAFMQDPINTTAPQLKKWQVLYDEAPECALNPLKGFAGINDTLQEGDQVTLLFPIENVGTKSFNDSLVVTYWIEDNNRNAVPLPHKLKAKPFAPGEILIDTVKINSYQLVGNNALWIYVNPSGHNKYQAEQHQFNNIGRWPFKVTKDITNPLLDVTFDGIRILNGDIVSAKPNILVSLKDENKFLELNDTSAFNVSILYPSQSIPQKLFFAKDLQFTPANVPKNSCSINYNPTLITDGKYVLMVTAKDRSNNRSGMQDYQVQFEVQNKSTITHVMNYPNPFTTSTKFVFTLTGSEIPEVFTIQIMTITGKIVKEITREELGFLHIGRNITEYAWDGRDTYGDRLANGVYLYRVVSKIRGEQIEKRESGADKFFTKEFGKMVLMR